MKYLKMFEKKYTLDYLKNVINDYDSVKDYLEPIGILKYYEIANSDLNEDPEYGDVPDKKVKENDLYMTRISSDDTGFSIEFITEDRFGELDATYIINITNQEVIDYEMKVDAKNFNL